MHYDPMIGRFILAATVLAALSGCASQSNVNVTSGGTVQTQSRSEPIFYNGQHYNIDYTYNQPLKLFDMKVSGTSVTMTAKDKNAAAAIATSALRYFACPDKLSSRLIGEPQFSSPVWSLQARCA
jgi:type IV pilus biogenesis protein CpaD/CtpE